MPTTYTLIASNIVTTSNVESVVFSSIPNTFTDLVFRFSQRMNFNSTSPSTKVKFNDPSSTAHSNIVLFAGDTVYYQVSDSGQSYINTRSNGSASASDIFSNEELYVANYAIAKKKPIIVFSVSEDDSTDTRISANGALFNLDDAITSATFTHQAGSSFAVGSSFYLYGISNAWWNTWHFLSLTHML